MTPRFTKMFTVLAAVGAMAVPAVAQAQGGTDDPPNHEQREHQVRHHHRRHDSVRDRRERRGDHRNRGGDRDDGLNHR